MCTCVWWQCKPKYSGRLARTAINKTITQTMRQTTPITYIICPQQTSAINYKQHGTQIYQQTPPTATTSPPPLLQQSSHKAVWAGTRACELREVATALGSHRLQQIKQESGGLQTLLKNHRHIFRVERGAVALRVRIHSNGALVALIILAY